VKAEVETLTLPRCTGAQVTPTLCVQALEIRGYQVGMGRPGLLLVTGVHRPTLELILHLGNQDVPKVHYCLLEYRRVQCCYPAQCRTACSAWIKL
jgi:hypothetical protein